jgi:hypothetical protein
MIFYKSPRFLYMGLVTLVGIQQCSSTLIAGTLFYLMMGNYLSREVVPNVLNSVVKSRKTFIFNLELMRGILNPNS